MVGPRNRRLNLISCQSLSLARIKTFHYHPGRDYDQRYGSRKTPDYKPEKREKPAMTTQAKPSGEVKTGVPSSLSARSCAGRQMLAGLECPCVDPPLRSS